MNNSKPIEIHTNKTKLFLMLLGALILALAALTLASYSTKINELYYINTILVFVLGLAVFLFFGVAVILLLSRLFDTTPSLIIEEDGIIDHASGLGVGFIAWSDIIEIKESNVSNHKMLNLIVKNPQVYIDRQRNVFKRKTMRMNYNTFGAAIHLSSKGLNCNHNELKTLLEQHFIDFKNNRKAPKMTDHLYT